MDASQEAENVGECADVDVEEMEAMSNQLMEQLVNIDLASFQYSVATLVHQATLIGIDHQELNIVDMPVNANGLYKYAKCIQQRSSAANVPLVRYIWNMFPFNQVPIVPWILDIIACPCCWWIVPFD